MAVLADKPGQEHVHWSEYIFRLCISYRPLKAVTRPFLFHIQRCDDAVDHIGSACYTITLDLDSGYWQVAMLEESKEKTAFYTPNGKKHWTRMPMGILNAHAFFTAMVVDMKKEWDSAHGENASEMLAKICDLYSQIQKKTDRLTSLPQASLARDDVPPVDPTFDFTPQQLQLSNPGSAVIVDDVILYDKFIPTLLAYFANCLKVLLFYRVTIKQRKTRVLPRRAKFVGVDVL